MNRRFGKNDVIFISFLAVFCIAVCVWVYKGGAVEGSNILITVDGKEYGFSIPGGGFISLQELIKMLEITGTDESSPIVSRIFTRPLRLLQSYL